MRARNKQVSANLLFILILACFVITAHAENWPAWRGSSQGGISVETGLPATWDQTSNVSWRLELPGPSPSTPAVWGDKIFLSSARGEQLLLLCVSTSGKLLWERHLGDGNKDIREGESNAASPSATTDGERVWIFTGTGVLACFDVDGNPLWKTDIQERYGTFNMYWGMSTSPLLDGDRLYMQLLHTDAQYVLALDKMTGEEVWRHNRKTDARVECLHSYATPVIYEDENNRYLLTHGADYIVAHSLEDGSELWRCGGLQKENNYNDYLRFVATPAVTAGLIVVPSAKNGPILGINPDNISGNITNNSEAFHWKWSRSTTDVPSPLIHDGLVYICRENGVLICIDAANGDKVYEESVHRRRHRASPVYADGKIYLAAMDGVISVIKAGRDYELISQNEMSERISASPAISNGTIYLRTENALYAIRK